MTTPWSLQPESALSEYGSSSLGLAPEEARKRLLQYGPNRPKASHRGPFLEALLSQLRNPLLWLLLMAAAVGIGVGEVTDAVMVVSIMVLGSIISIAQEGRAGQVLESLRGRLALKANVVREGSECEVPAADIVPGDVLVLAAGTLVAADAILLQARDLYLSEALLTGEPFPVEKRLGALDAETPLGERVNMVHTGTSVRSGTGRAVVVATGSKTAFGQLVGRLLLRPPETDFQRGLRRFGYLLLSTMLVLVFLVFGASAVRHHPPVEALMFAVALAVGLAPEMLPAVLATMLSRGARRMASQGVLVKRLEAMENLGSMDVLCTDKTGTLTEGTIRLEGAFDILGQPCGRVSELAYWNSRLQAGLPNPLDRAVVEALEEKFPDPPAKLDEIPFDFSRKRLSILVETSPPTLVTKGAFEPVLSVCEKVRRGAEVVLLERPLVEELRARIVAWGSQGVRVLAVSTREVPPPENLEEKKEILEGFLTFRDPPKEGARRAIDDLKSLGVKVKLVSGDHHAVVRHLAQEVGMSAHRVVKGSQLTGLREEALWHLADHVDVFAEVDPGQKERLLLALKRTGHVVGFMGDGINDAPALHAADVGIAVEGATDVAREAADFVLLERGLEVVRDGVREGRRTFANTMKYVLTTESANLGNMISMAAASLFLPFLPLLAHQVLLNNLLSDIPSATLSADQVDEELVERPQKWDIGFIRRFMMTFGLISALFDVATFLVLTIWFRTAAPEFRTAWFAESLLTELLVLLVLRTRRRFWRSRPHPALLVTTLLIAGVAFVLPGSPLGPLLEFTRLPGSVWLAVVAIAVGYVATVEVAKKALFQYLESSSRRLDERGRTRIWPRS